MNILVDANILVRLRDAASPHHAPCAEAIQRGIDSGHTLMVCTQALIEYWVVATRPIDVNGLGLSPAQAETDLQDFDMTFLELPEPSDIGARWRELVRRYGVSGRPAHDTRYVALMLAHGITNLLTLNPRDFARYSEITCLAPAGI